LFDLLIDVLAVYVLVWMKYVFVVYMLVFVYCIMDLLNKCCCFVSLLVFVVDLLIARLICYVTVYVFVMVLVRLFVLMIVRYCLFGCFVVLGMVYILCVIVV